MERHCCSQGVHTEGHIQLQQSLTCRIQVFTINDWMFSVLHIDWGLVYICWEKERCLQWWNGWAEFWRKIRGIVWAKEVRRSVKYMSCADTGPKSRNFRNGAKVFGVHSNKDEAMKIGSYKWIKGKSLNSSKSGTPK